MDKIKLKKKKLIRKRKIVRTINQNTKLRKMKSHSNENANEHKAATTKLTGNKNTSVQE